MRDRPNSETGFPWFLYKIRRKIRYLKHRGTLFHKTPRKKSQLEVKKRNAIRKLRYLAKDGKIFKICLSRTRNFIKENILFIGQTKYLIIIANSTAIFLLAYLVVFITGEFSTGFAASTFNIRTILLYHDVDFLIRSKDWAGDAVQVVFSTGPFSAFLLTLVSLFLFLSLIEQKWTSRLLILWIFCHSVIQLLGQIVFGAIFNQSFGWVLAYMYFGETEKMMLVVFLLIMMFVCGIFIPKFFLLTGNIYFNYLVPENRMHLVISQVLLPFVIGTGLIFLIKQPRITNLEMVVDGSMLFLLLPVVLRSRFASDLFFDEEPRKIRIKWAWMLAMGVILVAFRILFWKGIRL